MRTIDKNPQPEFIGVIPKSKFGMLIKCAEEVGLVEDDLIAFLNPTDAEGDVIEDHLFVYLDQKNLTKSGPLWDKYSTNILIEDVSNGD